MTAPLIPEPYRARDDCTLCDHPLSGHGRHLGDGPTRYDRACTRCPDGVCRAKRPLTDRVTRAWARYW